MLDSPPASRSAGRATPTRNRWSATATRLAWVIPSASRERATASTSTRWWNQPSSRWLSTSTMLSPAPVSAVPKPVRPLVGQELRGGERGGPDGVLRDVDPAPEQARAQVTRREDRVVRQDEEAPPRVDEGLDELGGTGDGLLLVDEHAVHVGEPALDGFGVAHAPIVP